MYQSFASLIILASNGSSVCLGQTVTWFWIELNLAGNRLHLQSLVGSYESTTYNECFRMSHTSANSATCRGSRLEVNLQGAVWGLKLRGGSHWLTL